MDFEELRESGYCLLRSVFPEKATDRIRRELRQALESAGAGGIRSRGGSVYAARNVADWFSQATTLWQVDQLTGLLSAVLGDDYGLVRVLYFDKPPEQTWSLPWHKDLTVAVQDNSLPTMQFRNPTTKASIPHVEAPQSLLERMLTLRLHLDDVDHHNGPLQVIRGSHLGGKEATESGEIDTILASRGDVLAMRPLLSHSSPSHTSGSTHSRRILHFEFAGQRKLPDGYRWRMFVGP